MKLSDEERQAYERYQHDLHYQASMVESSYTIGLRKGEKKGKEEGRAEGRTEGQLEGKREVAVKLLASGSLEIEAIAEITGLSVEELQGLKQGLGLMK
ncbi:MAG: hypothetical protein SD837_10015 [Candidatus Electrothrix scaldis]|nr:MAG: hypothetical protein SD837_10015 [Candidatus Electrothrix sp. GW3-3]